MKHTPGPWNIYTEVSEDGPAIFGPSGVVHVQVFKKPRANADAQLIAAAPDLLEASDRMLKLIFDEIGLTREQIKLVHATGLIKAIKKARGEL